MLPPTIGVFALLLCRDMLDFGSSAPFLTFKAGFGLKQLVRFDLNASVADALVGVLATLLPCYCYPFIELISPESGVMFKFSQSCCI